MEERTIYRVPLRRAPKLFVYGGGAMQEWMLEGAQSFGRSGKAANPALTLPQRSVSRAHGLFVTDAYGSRYQDVGSTNGTMLNAEPIEPQRPYLLKDGDVLRIHARGDDANEMDVVMIYSTSWHDGTVWKKQPLNDSMAEIVVGRSEGLALHDGAVSRKHASFFRATRGWAVIDHGSLNGVMRNNRRLEQPEYLQPMDVVRIADFAFLFTGDALYWQAQAAPEAPAYSARPEGSVGGLISTMRDGPSRSLPPRPAAGGGGFRPAEPLGGEAGTPRPVTPPRPVAPPAPPVTPRSVTPPAPHAEPGLSIDIVERSVVNRLKKKMLLKDIKLDIPMSSMVLILGGSGAGKTTFMNAVMGYEQAKGTIRYRGTDIYEEYEKMKYEIGYVPQQDLVRENDTVYATLRNAAEMRMPASSSEEEYAARVAETLKVLGLEREKDSYVGKLSGGQRKRLSIAVEYVGSPALFFLDEPDSGLDGTMARALMENLRQIADSGKIVMVISHSPDRAFELFDQVIVLAKGSHDDCGHLVFSGAPKAACAFFGVESLEKIVRRINRRDEGGDGMADYYIEKFEAGGAR